MSEGSDTAPFPLRAVGALSGGIAGSVIAALLLAVLANRGDVPFFAVVGLLLPVALLLGGMTALLVIVTNPGSRLQPWSIAFGSRRARTKILVATSFLLFVWFGLGNLAVRLLGAFSERAGVGGVLLAAAGLGVLVAASTGGEWLAKKLAERWSPPGLGMTLIVAALLFVGVVGLLVTVGSTSGTGSTIALFGVFKRPELDLGPALHCVAMVLVSGGVAFWCLNRRLGFPLSAASVALGLSAWAWGQAAAIEFRQAVEVERARGLTGVGLALGRRMTDADGDGAASAFGGGDCDDSNAEIHPGAIDVPDNGLDEDCRGGDRQKTAPADKPEASRQEASAKLPDEANVLLLTIDTLRWDLGYTRSNDAPRLSPRLDELAARSTVFENAYALASYTSKSLGPMMLGRYPSETKRTFEHFDRFSPDVPFLAERLQANGILTTSIQGYWYFFFKGYGFERGWDVLDSSAAPKLVAIEGDKTSNGDQLATKTIENLEKLKEQEKRFFLWTHWVDPHAEYVAHEEFDFGREPRQRYDGEVAFVDAQIGRILDALKRLQLDEETVVIVTSDHGEAFGEHGMIRHGFEVWDVLMRVPLIVHVPGVATRRVKVRRSIIDIAPTVLEAFGVDAPSSAENFIRGTSLLRDALAAPGTDLAERPVLVDMPQAPHNQERRAFYDGDLKLITSAGRPLGLYDIVQDPDEKNDLSKDAARLEPMQAKMDAFLDTLQTVQATR